MPDKRKRHVPPAEEEKDFFLEAVMESIPGLLGDYVATDRASQAELLGLSELELKKAIQLWSQMSKDRFSEVRTLLAEQLFPVNPLFFKTAVRLTPRFLKTTGLLKRRRPIPLDKTYSQNAARGRWYENWEVLFSSARLTRIEKEYYALRDWKPLIESLAVYPREQAILSLAGLIRNPDTAKIFRERANAEEANKPRH